MISSQINGGPDFVVEPVAAAGAAVAVAGAAADSPAKRKSTEPKRWIALQDTPYHNVSQCSIEVTESTKLFKVMFSR